MNKLPEITVTKSGYEVPEPWLQFEGQPAPGVYVVIPKAKMHRDALARILCPIKPGAGWPCQGCLHQADAILAHLGGGE